MLRCGGEDPCACAGWHVHPEYEIVYVRNGAGRLPVATRIFAYDDGALLLLGPDVPHADFGNAERADALEVVVQFSAAFAREKLAVFPELAAVQQLLDRSAAVLRFGRGVRARLDATFAGLVDAGPAGRLVGALEVLRVLADAGPGDVEALFAAPPASGAARPRGAARLERVFAFVSARYAESVSSADAAAHVGLTTNAFCRFFRRHTGRAFVDVLNEFRVRRARDLLADPAVSVREAMVATGFRDPSYFGKVFRRYAGRAPSAARLTRV